MLELSPIVRAPKLVEKSYTIGRHNSETSCLGQSNLLHNLNTSISDNQQTKVNIETLGSGIKSPNDQFELDECIIKNSFNPDSLNNSAQKPRQTVTEFKTSPLPFDTFRYNIEFSRREPPVSIEGTIRRESAAFRLEESLSRSNEKGSVAKQPESVTYFDILLKEHVILFQ